MKNKLFILFLIFSFLLTSGFGCKGTDQTTQQAMQPVTLNYWRVWDGPDAFEEIISNYKALHPYITINYRKLRYSEYEQALLEAMAEDKGPDILSLHNTWLPKYQSKLAPLPAEITMVFPVEKGTIKKEVIQELRTSKSLNLRDLQNNFVDTVFNDVVLDNKDEKTGKTTQEIFGLPLALDTLAMYYNKDLLNNAGIAEPPVYWNREFQQDVKKLTKQDTSGRIIQSGVALGSSSNIGRYSDILSTLMMQNGAIMADENNNVIFDKVPSSFENQNYSPGLEALRFYTDFSNPAKEVYSWNSDLENSLEMFISGKLALMFSYAYDLPTIKSRAPKLNFSVMKMPQIEGNTGNISLANYWVETVSNKSKYINEAWDFVQFATKAEQVKSYLTKTDKPTALRSLVNEQISGSDINPFAEQVLTARSWYHGQDANAAELIIGEMIDSVVNGEAEIEEAISLGAKRVQQTMK
jgi:multiple sugar transport system substrate-binding protein